MDPDNKSAMKLTSKSERIEKAHFILQKLEDRIAGFSGNYPGNEAIYKNRLDELYKEVWNAIHQLNEAYDCSHCGSTEHLSINCPDTYNFC